MARPEESGIAPAWAPLCDLHRSPLCDMPMNGVSRRRNGGQGALPPCAVLRRHQSMATTWETIMYEGLATVDFPELMTETELMHFLRIPHVSAGTNPHNVVDNLKRFHQLPCIHISRQPLYPLVAVRRWVEEKLAKERRP